MELQDYGVQVYAKAETRGLSMAFLVKIPQAITSVTSQFFRVNQIGLEQVLDNLTFEYVDPLRKQYQSLVDYVLNHCFWTLTM